MDQVQRFLWFVAGFDGRTLSNDSCRSVRAKYSSIGLLMLITAILAGCSGTYAVSTVFGSIALALPFGVLWGCFILALDRYLLASTRKLARIKDNLPMWDSGPAFEPHRSWASFAGVLLRLSLAAVIGVVVAKPLEVRILHPWTQEYEREKRTADRTAQLGALAPLQAAVGAAQGRLDAKSAEVSRTREKLIVEVQVGQGPRPRGDGPVARAVRAELDGYRAEETVLAGRLRDAENRLAAERAAVEGTIKHEGDQRNRSLSFITGIEAIHELANAGGTRARVVTMVSLFITALFVIIEISPVLSKAIAGFDVYDAMLLERDQNSILIALTAARRAHHAAVARDDEGGGRP